MRFCRALSCGYSLVFTRIRTLTYAFMCQHVYLLYLFNAVVNAAAAATAGYEYSSSASGSSLRSVAEAGSATAAAAAAAAVDARRRMSMLLAIVDSRIYVSAVPHTHKQTHTRSKVLPINILIFMANKFTSFALRGHFLFCFSFCCWYFSCIKGFKSNAINLCQTPGELYAGFAIVNKVKAIFARHYLRTFRNFCTTIRS